MKCIVCGGRCHKQLALDGKKAPKYPNLCTECNRRRMSELLIMADDGTKYAFIPATRAAKQSVIEIPKFPHPRNFILVPGSMIGTFMEKLYPLTEEEKHTKKRIADLRGEKDDLEGELAEIEAKIEELEEELECSPDRDIKPTWWARQTMVRGLA